MSAVRWGLAGLLAFEVLLFGVRLADGSLDEFSAMALLAAGALAWALAAHVRANAVPRAALAALALVTLARALAQTVPGISSMGVLPTFLVPLGFALLLWPRAPPTLGIGLVAAARSWFALWYFLLDAPGIALANVVGAAGAWVWFVGVGGDERASPADETARAPPV